MKRKANIFSVLMLSLFFAVSTPVSSEAQCPMCRMSAESNLAQGGSAGKGLNKGIMMMLSMPYVMMATIGYIWYRNRRKEEEVDYDAM